MAIFDFSLDKGGEKYVESWDEYMPTRVAAGEFDCVVGPKVVFTPMVYETPVRTIVEAGMTLFWLREHHPDISVELNPIANVEATFANAVNTELRAFSGIEGVMLANDFPVAEKLAGCVLSLPMHTELDNEQLAYITSSVLELCRK